MANNKTKYQIIKPFEEKNEQQFWENVNEAIFNFCFFFHGFWQNLDHEIPINNL